jgi:hypothetical protein
MPIVLRAGPYRLFFYSGDGAEPIHVHIERDGKVAKYWVSPVRLADPGAFAVAELRRIQRVVSQHERAIISKWHEYFDS